MAEKAAAKTSAGNRLRKAFTLIELLVVIAIIALVIAITLPALAGARTVAKIGATKGFIQEATKAAEAYRLDQQGKAPGYFNAHDMGSVENAARGFTAMQNLMLDLAGGIVDVNDPDKIEVGPLNLQTTHVYVNPGLMGSKKGYFSPDSKYLQVQDGTQGGMQFGAPEHQKLPSVVDAWGNPMLLWSQDETAIGTITDKNQFAQVDSSGPIARFYWASNAGLLKSTALGRSAKDQNYGGAGSEYSLIGGGLIDADIQDSLVGILGSPSYPNTLDPPYNAIVPTQAKGRTVVQSAGPDGVFMGSKDEGYDKLDYKGPEFKDGVIKYLNNFYTNTGSITRFLDAKGNPTTEPVTEKFDDILVSGGN